MASQAELAAMFDGGTPAQEDLSAAFESAVPRERGIGEELWRQVGLTARAGLEGIGAIPNTIGDVVGLDSSRGFSNLLTRAGLPVAETDIEKLNQAVVGGGASAVLPIGVGASMARSAAPVTKGVGEMLAKDAGQQIALSGVAGAGAHTAAESGADGLGQMGAGIGSSVLAQLLARGQAGVGGRVGQIVDTAIGKGGDTRAAGRVAVDVTKERTVPVIQALKEGTPVETAAQAAVPAGSAEFSGLEAMIAGRNPSIYGPDGTVVKAQTDYINQLWKDLKTSTTALREAELAGANVAGEVGTRLKQQIAEKQASLAAALQTGGKAATEAAQQEVLSNKWFPVTGQPRISGRYSHNADRVPEWAGTADDVAAIAAQRRAEGSFRQGQLDSIAAHGMQPLTVENIIGNIDAKLSTPGLRASDTAQTILGSFKNKIASLVGPDGVIDSRDLYTVRKEMGNKINVLARQEQWDKRLTEGLVHDVQRTIDTAIGKASGSLRRDGTSDWTDYLKKYSTGAKKIEGVTERIETSGRMGNVGREEAQRLFNAEGIPVTLPNLLSRPMMVANALVRFMEGKGGQKTRNELSRLMQPQNKAELAKVMEMELALRGGNVSIADVMKRATVAGSYGSNHNEQ